MAANGRHRRTRSGEALELGSLRELQDTLPAHGGEIGRSVGITGLPDARDAATVRDLLPHQEEVMEGTAEEGMGPLEALVIVDGGVPAVGSSAKPAEHAETLAPSSDRNLDFATDIPALGYTRLDMERNEALEVARRMLRAGTGVRGDQLVPSAALLDLATRVLQDEGPSDRCLDFAADDPALANARLAAEDDTEALELARRMLQAGTEPPRRPARPLRRPPRPRHPCAPGRGTLRPLLRFHDRHPHPHQPLRRVGPCRRGPLRLRRCPQLIGMGVSSLSLLGSSSSFVWLGYCVCL